MSADLTIEEIVNILRRIRYAPTLASLSRDSGVSSASIYRAIQSGHISDKLAKRIERVMRNTSNEPHKIRRSAPLPDGLRGRL